MSWLSVASSLSRGGEVLCCRWAVLVQWIEVSLALQACRAVHPREVPGRFPPSASTNPLPEPLVLWAAPSPLRTSTTCIVGLNWTRLEWTGFFRPHDHRSRTRRQLDHPDSQPSSTHRSDGPRQQSPESLRQRSSTQCLRGRVARIVHHMPNLHSLVERWPGGDDGAIAAVSICLSPELGVQGDGIWTYRAVRGQQAHTGPSGQLG